MNKNEAIQVWENYQNIQAETFAALDKLDAFMKTDKYRLMCGAFGENEENYCFRKDFKEFMEDLPDAMGY
jgi:hypothetical protein